MSRRVHLTLYIACIVGVACAGRDESAQSGHDPSTGAEIPGTPGRDSYVIYDEPSREDEHDASGHASAGEPSAVSERERVPDVCPADIDGLNVRVSAVPGGGALVFTAPADKVSDLRDRLNHFAEIHAESRSSEHEHDPIGVHGHEEFVDAQAMIHRARDVRVVDIPRGARLEFRLEDGASVQELRAELREDARILREGACPLAMTLVLI